MLNVTLNYTILFSSSNTGRTVSSGTGWDSYRFYPLRILQWRKEMEAIWTTIKLKCDFLKNKS